MKGYLASYGHAPFMHLFCNIYSKSGTTTTFFSLVPPGVVCSNQSGREAGNVKGSAVVGTNSKTFVFGNEVIVQVQPESKVELIFTVFSSR